MKRILILALLTTTNTYAEEPLGRKLCPIVKEYAEEIMTQRQDGSDLSNVIIIANQTDDETARLISSHTAEDAAHAKIETTLADKIWAINSFTEFWTNECYKDFGR